MIEDYFGYVYITGVVIITVLMFVVTRLIYKESNEVQAKLITQNVGTTDAFQRVRISNPFTLGDYKHVYGDNPDMLNHIVNGGTVLHNPNESSVKLAVADTIGSRAVHQSKMYHHYMPGKSQLIMSTFVFKEQCKGVSKKVGYFDDRDGIFFEQDENGVLNFVIRSFVTGVAKERVVKQDDWNGDRLNGKGGSKWKIDVTKTQLSWFDFQWLGVGRVRCGFVHEDEYVLCQTFYNSDILDKVFMSNPNLPLRCEIENISSNRSCNFDQICGTVISEGGYSEGGRDFSAVSGTITLTPPDPPDPPGGSSNVIGILLKNSFKNRQNRMFIRLLDVGVFSDGSDVKYEVIKVNGEGTTASITGAATASANTESGVQYIDDCAIVGTSTEEVIQTGFVQSQTEKKNTISSYNSSSPSDAKKNFISQNFSSTFSDAFVVKVTELKGEDTDVIVTMTWREIY